LYLTFKVFPINVEFATMLSAPTPSIYAESVIIKNFGVFKVYYYCISNIFLKK